MRIVFLTKLHPTSIYLSQRLSEEKELVGIIYEEVHHNPKFIYNFFKRYLKKFGLIKSVDTFFYFLFEKFFRKKAVEEGLNKYLPLKGPADHFPQGSHSLKVTNMNSDQSAEIIKSLDPDLAVVMGTRLLKPKIFNLPKFGTINVHCGILPKYRGQDSTFWALYHKDLQNIGATLHYIDEGVDTGNVIERCYVQYELRDNDLSLYYKNLHNCVEVLIKVISQIEDHSLKKESQKGQEASYFFKKTFSDYLRFRTVLKKLEKEFRNYARK